MRVYRNNVAALNNSPRPYLPEWFVRELTAFGGTDTVTGKPMLRVVHGQDRDSMEFRGGEWRVRYLLGWAKCDFHQTMRGQQIEIGGVKTHIETPLIGSIKKKEAVGSPYYFVEPFIPTRWMCSEEYWEEHIRWERINPTINTPQRDETAIQRVLQSGNVDGIVEAASSTLYRTDIMGPYPRNGFYGAGWRLLNHDFSPASPNQKSLDEIKVHYTNWLADRQLTAQQILDREAEFDRVQEEYEAEQFKKDLVAAIRDIKLQVLGHSVSLPGAKVGAGLDAR